jgi:hypothetical protein
LFSSQDAAQLVCVAFCWDEAADGFHDIRHFALCTLPATTTLKILLKKKNFRSVMKSFMVMEGDGVKC